MTFTDTILNDIERAEVQRFADNSTMFEAVKKVLLASVYFQGTLIEGKESNPLANFALQIVAGDKINGRSVKTNEQIGSELRARYEGVNFVEGGFEDLRTYKSKQEVVEDTTNPAR